MRLCCRVVAASGFRTAKQLSLAHTRGTVPPAGAGASSPSRSGSGAPGAAAWIELMKRLPSYLQDEATTPPLLASAVVLLLADLKVWIVSDTWLLKFALELSATAVVMGLRRFPPPGAAPTPSARGAALLFVSSTQALKDLCVTCSKRTLMVYAAARGATGSASASDKSPNALVGLLFKLLWRCARAFQAAPVGGHIAAAGQAALQALQGGERHRGLISAWGWLLEGLMAVASTLLTMAEPSGPVARPAATETIGGASISTTGSQVFEALLAPLSKCIRSNPHNGARLGVFRVVTAVCRGADVAVAESVHLSRNTGLDEAATFVTTRLWPHLLAGAQAALGSAHTSEAFCQVQDAAVHCTSRKWVLTCCCLCWRCIVQVLSSMVQHFDRRVAQLVPVAANHLCQVFVKHWTPAALEGLRTCVTAFGDVVDMQQSWASVLALVVSKATTTSTEGGTATLRASPECVDAVFKLASSVLVRNAAVVLVPVATAGGTVALTGLLHMAATMLVSPTANSRAVNGAAAFALSVMTGHCASVLVPGVLVG